MLLQCLRASTETQPSTIGKVKVDFNLTFDTSKRRLMARGTAA